MDENYPPEVTADPEFKKLDEMEHFVLSTIDEMLKLFEKDPDMDDAKFDVSVTLNGKTFKLGNCAKEYEGLLVYIKYMKSEI